MKLFKKAAGLLIAAAISISCTVSAFAESPTPVGAELYIPENTAPETPTTPTIPTTAEKTDDVIDGTFPDISDKAYEAPKLTDYEEWNGRNDFDEDTVYVVSGLVVIKDDDKFTLPESSKLILTDDAFLIVSTRCNLYIGGELIIAPEATLTISGGFSVLKGGRLENFGTVAFTVSSVADISAQYINYTGSKSTFSGDLYIYKDGEFINYSSMTFSPNSTLKSTGIWQSLKDSTLLINGKVTITLSGKTDLAGHVVINGYFANSGLLVYEDTIKLFTEPESELILTKSGRLIDRREPDAEDPEEEFRAGVKGIDVSVWQGVIDWKKVKDSGVKFAIIRSSFADTQDKMFEYNITEAAKAGINVGVYHYCYAMNVEEAREEAQFFIETVKPYQINYPLMFDFEDNTQIKLGREALTDIAEAFLSELKNAGYYPMIYSYKNWLNNLLDMDRLSEYEVAVAEWDVPKSTYTGPYGIWQYSCKGKISGIEGDVDLDICYKDYAKIIREGNFNHLS